MSGEEITTQVSSSGGLRAVLARLRYLGLGVGVEKLTRVQNICHTRHSGMASLGYLHETISGPACRTPSHCEIYLGRGMHTRSDMAGKMVDSGIGLKTGTALVYTAVAPMSGP